MCLLHSIQQAIARALGADALVGNADAAIYMMVRLPADGGADDDEGCMEFLIKEHGVAVLPASSCGYPGCLRVCYANLGGDQ